MIISSLGLLIVFCESHPFILIIMFLRLQKETSMMSRDPDIIDLVDHQTRIWLEHLEKY